MATQRIRVRGRDARLVGGLALVFSALVVGSGPSPTGAAVVDVPLVFAASAFVVWSAASAPWWAGVVSAGIASAFAPSAWWLLIGLATVAAGLAVGSARRSLPWSRAAIAGMSMLVFAHLGDGPAFGLTSLMAILTLGALSVFGVRRRPRATRRRLWAGAGIVCGAAVCAVVGAGVAGLMARAEVEEAVDKVREGLSLLSAGEVESATVVLDDAAELFEQADADLSRPWAQPARLVPVVAQHLRAARELTTAGAAAVASLADQATLIDFDSLAVVNGTIDVDAISVLARPVASLQSALQGLVGSIESVRAPWLVEPVDELLVEALDELVARQDDVDAAVAAVDAAPAMLGADGPRVYFVAFTTPAEARGAGGFMGNWAEVTVDGGRFSITDFGRTADLRGGAAEKTLVGPDPAFTALYGAALWSDLQRGVVGSSAWSNVMVSPHFPSVAQVIAELYPQSGGTAVDGVFLMDVYALARMMSITGAVTLPDGTTIDTTNAADYLLRQQYLIEDSAERVDVLETAARTSILRLFTSTLPSPRQLGELFGDVAREGRLAGWAVRPDEQAVLRRASMTAELPPLDGGDGFGFAFNNGSASKIEVFLEGAATYDVRVNRARQRVDATATLTLTNRAPSEGLPEYVIGNQVGLPWGTSRLQVLLYSALPVTGFRVDGDDAGFVAGTEQGYFVTTAFVDIAAGATRVITLDVGGPIDPAASYRVITRVPPTVEPMPLTVTVDPDNTDPAPPEE